jgi:hypothetical protein
MTITENNTFKCQYCNGEIGEFNEETGNHVICEENAELRRTIASLQRCFQPTSWQMCVDALRKP